MDFFFLLPKKPFVCKCLEWLYGGVDTRCRTGFSREGYISLETSLSPLPERLIMASFPVPFSFLMASATA